MKEPLSVSKYDAEPVLGPLNAVELQQHANPALRRLAEAVDERNAAASITNYSRMYHRHARSHTRK